MKTVRCHKNVSAFLVYRPPPPLLPPPFPDLFLSHSVCLSLSFSLSLRLYLFLSLCVSPSPPFVSCFSLSVFYTRTHRLMHTRAGLYTHSCMLLDLNALSSAVSEFTLLFCASRKHVLIYIIFQVSSGSTGTLPSGVHLRRT